MKSALCRTLSKIFCSWGLMKELSKEEKGEKLSKKTFSVARNILCEQHFTAVRTLNAQHLPNLKCCSTNLTQCVDYSLSIGLWQERRVQQGAHVYKNNSTHRQRQREAVRSGARKNILQHQVQQHKQEWLLLATTVKDLLHENNELLPWTELNWTTSRCRLLKTWSAVHY